MAYENLAYIASGNTDGSTQVLVVAAATNGTLVFVCDENDLSTLGTGEMLGGECLVSVSPALTEGQRIIAFLGEIGLATIGGREVLASGETFTGWKLPQTIEVNGTPIDVEEYETTTGQKVPALYDPEAINRVAQINSAFFDSIPAQEINFGIRIDRNYGTTTVTVENVTGAPNGFLIQFDGGAIGNTDAKTYTANGTYIVKVLDAQNSARSLTRTYVVSSTSPPPATSDISNASYTQSGQSVQIIADALSSIALEGKIDGVSASYADLVFLGGKRWISGAYTIPTAGAYVLRVRVKANTADEIIINATII